MVSYRLALDAKFDIQKLYIRSETKGRLVICISLKQNKNTCKLHQFQDDVVGVSTILWKTEDDQLRLLHEGIRECLRSLLTNIFANLMLIICVFCCCDFQLHENIEGIVFEYGF